MSEAYCIICGELFQPSHPNIAICPACGGPLEAGSAPAEDFTQVASPIPPVNLKSVPRPSARKGEWQPGMVILDTYEVAGELGRGGFGKVYRVHHKAWNIDLAVKRPLELEEASKVSFIAEAEKWIDLGLHPNIVSCYYVRSIDNFPHTFAELVEGGSLKSWIDDHRLYAGGQTPALERILDIAIQFAWGLDYAHQKRLVHQDVKPGNVLMTLDGVAKVGDFGLSKARQLPGPAMTLDQEERLEQADEGSLLVSSGGYTPAYCSPEQARSERLSHKTDIWSWAVSVLEMFNGEITWYRGTAAAEALEEYTCSGASVRDLPMMPPALVDLLRQCLEKAPEARPRSLLEVAEKLQGIYQRQVGKPYPRRAPKSVDLRADSLNNKALSFLDLGRAQAALGAWEEALRNNPTHLEATFNLGYWEWNQGRRDDLRFWQSVAELDRLYGERAGYWTTLAQLSRARGDLEQADQHGKKAAKLGGKPISARPGTDIRLKDVLQTPNGLYCMRLSPNGRFLLTGGLDKTVRLYDLHSKQIAQSYLVEVNHGEIFSLGIMPNWSTVLCGSLAEWIEAFDTASGKYLGRISDEKVSGSNAAVLSVLEVTPDSRYVISALNEMWAIREVQSIHLWDPKTGKLAGTLEGHLHAVTSLVVTQDSRRAISSGWSDSNEFIKIWDLNSRRGLRTLKGPDSMVHCLAVSKDGRWLLSGSENATMALWDLDSGQMIRTYYGHSAAVRSLDFSPDGRFAISGSEDRTVRFWDLESGKCLRTFSDHTNSVRSVVFSQDGMLAYSASLDCSVRIYSTQFLPLHSCDFLVSVPVSAEKTLQRQDRMAELLDRIDGHLQSGRFEPAYLSLRQAQEIPGYEKATALLDRLGKLSPASRRVGLHSAWMSQTLTGHTEVVNFVSFSPDGSQVASVSSDRVVRLWEPRSGACTVKLEGHRRPVQLAVFSPQGDILATASKGGYLSDKDADSFLRLWQVKGGQPIRSFQNYERGVSAVVFSPDGSKLYVAPAEKLMDKESGAIQILNARSGAVERTLSGHSDIVTSLALFGGGKFLLSGSRDQTLKVWQLTNGECLRTLTGHQGSVQALAALAGDRYAISGGVDNLLRLWDLQTGKCLRTLTGHKDTIQSIAVTRDGRFALSGGEEFALRLWDLQTGSVLQELEGHTDSITSLDFSPNGRYAISASYDKTLKLWEFDWELDFKK